MQVGSDYYWDLTIVAKTSYANDTKLNFTDESIPEAYRYENIYSYHYCITFNTTNDYTFSNIYQKMILYTKYTNKILFLVRNYFNAGKGQGCNLMYFS